MKHRLLALWLLLVVVSALSIYHVQERALEQTRRALTDLRPAATEPGSGASDAGSNLDSPRAAASLEVLRLRGQVGVLRRALAEAGGIAQDRRQFRHDWETIYSGARPSDQPGFVTLSNLVPAGFATPENALQSFHYIMGRQQIEPLNDTRMKEIWDVPDDYDQPPGYNIDLGEGFYGGIGYRIVRSEFLSSNTARLTIDYEKEDGSSYRRDKIFVATNGHWRMKPAAVTRAHSAN